MPSDPVHEGDAPQLTRFQLPGFGLPLNFIPRAESDDAPATGEGRDLFTNALNTNDIAPGAVHVASSSHFDSVKRLPLLTLREITMLHLMNKLTDKPDWNKNVFDDVIASKWKSEALATEALDITQSMVDWCIDELRYKAKLFEETGAVSVYNGDVVKSDTVIPSSLKEALRKAVAPLEQVPARQQDWHPGSDEKVLDLVHPSLFPLVYGRSRILRDTVVGLDDCAKRCGEGETVPKKRRSFLTRSIIMRRLIFRSHLSQNHSAQSSSGCRAMSIFLMRIVQSMRAVKANIPPLTSLRNDRITSYINNLHPEKHKDLYTPLRAQYLYGRRIAYDFCEYDRYPEDEEVGPQREEGEDEDDYEYRRLEWYYETRKVLQPEPGAFASPSVPDHIRELIYVEGTNELKPEYSTDIRRDYAHRGLQVIVKLASIHLTPEKSEYGGGTWHVDGQLNEHSCATATYYFDTENITPNRLAFRQQCEMDANSEIRYLEGHNDGIKVVFGCDPYGPCVQDVGTVDTPEGRLLTYPAASSAAVQARGPDEAWTP